MSNIRATDLIPPAEGSGDAAHTAARMLLGTVPIVGGTAVEIFNLIVMPPVQKHLAAWRESLAGRLVDLIRDVSDIQAEIERLQSNDQFIATVLEASRIAAATRSTEKLQALKNAVLNVAAGIDVDEIERQLFLRYVDELTEAHLLVLRFAGGLLVKFTYPLTNVGPYQSQIAAAIPALAERKPLRLQIWQDLRSRGLVKDLPSAPGTIPPGIDDVSWTEPFGDAFLRFIEKLPEAVSGTPSSKPK